MMLFTWIIILALVQSASGIDINFLVLAAIFAGVKKGSLRGLFIGIFIGILAEILSSTLFGLNLVLYSAVGLLSGIVKERFYYKKNIVTDFLFSFFGMLFFYSAYFFFTRTAQMGIFFTIIFSAIVAPLLFRVIDVK